MSANNKIQLDVELSRFDSNSIQDFAETTIIRFTDDHDFAIDPQDSVGTLTLHFTIFPNELESELQFGDSRTILYLLAQDSITLENAFGSPQLNFTILETSNIESQLEFGLSKLNFKIYSESLVNENAFENDHALSFIIRLDSIEPTTSFGFDAPLLNTQIFAANSIISTVVIPTPNVLKVIGPLSINTTVAFSPPTFTDNIHRIILFKDDNLSKVSENDAVVVAGGIRINPSIQKTVEASSGQATLPSNPVGFISVNIDGRDYKIPYYNP
jgi:hypothetical protein